MTVVNTAPTQNELRYARFIAGAHNGQQTGGPLPAENAIEIYMAVSALLSVHPENAEDLERAEELASTAHFYSLTAASLENLFFVLGKILASNLTVPVGLLNSVKHDLDIIYDTRDPEIRKAAIPLYIQCVDRLTQNTTKGRAANILTEWVEESARATENRDPLYMVAAQKLGTLISSKKAETFVRKMAKYPLNDDPDIVNALRSALRFRIS